MHYLSGPAVRLTGRFNPGRCLSPTVIHPVFRNGLTLSLAAQEAEVLGPSITPEGPGKGINPEKELGKEEIWL